MSSKSKEFEIVYYNRMKVFLSGKTPDSIEILNVRTCEINRVKNILALHYSIFLEIKALNHYPTQKEAFVISNKFKNSTNMVFRDAKAMLKAGWKPQEEIKA
ncbi:MAG: hypothetical protein ACYDEF_03685 [Methanosarcina sp.]